MNKIDATDGKFVPDFYAVYVIEDPALGYFAGYASHGICVPSYSNSIDGAKKFDAFRDLSARETALAIMSMDRRMREHAKLWCYRRCDFYPEEYYDFVPQG